MEVMRVEIEGAIPGNVGESREVTNLLGQMNMPSRFLKFTIDNESFTTSQNKQGFTVPMHHFTIKGEDHATWQWLLFVVKALKDCGALINKAVAGETHTKMVNLLTQ